MRAKLEDLPSEILMGCFKYLYAWDLFLSFGQLNHRFNELLRTIPLHLHFQHILLSPAMEKQVVSLRLSNENTPGIIKDLFSLDQFFQLRLLS